MAKQSSLAIGINTLMLSKASGGISQQSRAAILTNCKSPYSVSPYIEAFLTLRAII